MLEEIIAGRAGQKEKMLASILKELGGVVVAYSGGVDSTYLMYKARQVLGENRVMAITASSELYPEEEINEARRMAGLLAVEHRVILTDELSLPQLYANPPDRCYHCKMELYRELANLARRENLPAVIDGANADDAKDYRPGLRAASESAVRSPLKEAGLTKQEIRWLARREGLPNWDKPAAACLASRFPYGESLDRHKIRRVGDAERFLRQIGIAGDLRVRYHGQLARIEVSAAEMPVLLELGREITEYFKKIGFAFTTLDLEGFVSGSMNRTLENEITENF
ncbi:MAG: ATP-dependent sacrificial sulfur transferase LarE [Bacillota bacterium]